MIVNTCRSPLPPNGVNRLSMLSDPMQLLRLSVSNQDLHSSSSSMNQLDIIGRQGIRSLPTGSRPGGSIRSLDESELVDMRYVESPVAALSHSSVMVASDLSIEEEGVAHSDKKIAELGMRNSYPCSHEKEDGGVHSENGEVRSSSFSADQRNMMSFKKNFNLAAESTAV